MKITTKLAYLILPPYVWPILMREWRLTWCRFLNLLSPRRRCLINKLNLQQKLKIHLGCGSRAFPGWINIDGKANPGVDLLWDLRYPLPFSDASTRAIYCEHILEHLTEEDAFNLLKECHRILEQGGNIRIGVPDAELYLKAYTERNSEFFKMCEHLGGSVKVLSTPIRVINQMFRMGEEHLFAWDFETLAACMESIGFTDILKWEPGKASRDGICLDDPSHAFETLYLEASRPSKKSI